MKTAEKILEIIKSGENIGVEFKTCRDAVNKDVYDTVCAFLNRFGGQIILGVSDKGAIKGINPDAIEQIKKDFVTAVNNPSKITPTIYLAMEQVKIAGKLVLYIYVPASSQVHKCNGKIFDRNQDGDLNITGKHDLVTNLYLNKQTFYTENRVYPYCELSDLRGDIIDLARKNAGFQRHNHPWTKMDDLALLKSGKLHNKDFQTGKEGITLAGILLFGKDETILSAVPHYKTDLILRRNNLDRYDDRDDVRTNLLDSYERIIAFARKHLPDPFYLEGIQRISVRDKIMREVASNILIHREYMNAFPAKIIIERQRIYCENGNKPHSSGVIDPDNFTPYPKNPVIAGVFKQMGLADELGSGVRNLLKYGKIFSHAAPELIEDDIFKIIIQLPQESKDQADKDGLKKTVNAQVTDQVTAQVNMQVTAQVGSFCQEPRSAKEIMAELGLKHRKTFQANYLNPLIEAGFVERTVPDKPHSRLQKYRLTTSGKAWLAEYNPLSTSNQTDNELQTQPENFVGAQDTTQVATQVTVQVLSFCQEPRSAKEIMAELGLKHRKTFQANYLSPLIEAVFVERTVPDKPHSRLQKYRLTTSGKAWLAEYTPLSTSNQTDNELQTQPENFVGAQDNAQVTTQVTTQVLSFCQEPRSAKEIMAELGLKHRKTFQANYLSPLIEVGFIERTIPDKPRSSLQRYRLTDSGKVWLAEHK